MEDHVAAPSIDLTGRLSRRMALRTYAPPALAVIAVSSTGSLGQSGRILVEPEPKKDLDKKKDGGGGTGGGTGGGESSKKK